MLDKPHEEKVIKVLISQFTKVSVCGIAKIKGLMSHILWKMLN